MNNEMFSIVKNEEPVKQPYRRRLNIDTNAVNER